MTIYDYMASAVLIVFGLVAGFFPGVIMEWRSVATAPFDSELEVAVINYDGTHALVFPCRRVLGGWIDAKTKTRLTIFPTHWREWKLTSERTTFENA